ncbi:P-loop containing nucleoside triphosphate hydrolase protein [Mucor lusitanicus]|uniref:Sulfotransferase family protein n=2 Tax=Mucor circinelloides f. lusitanicus TaxID=29924 RepID=A0A168GPT2_MUCCL|nr:P-loop containing nucleoside triphosphate hydrolase protein [Mucor lusitanicus]OAC97908.1 hypothetical protein MUCCIDRAFT_168060 [Mucor lusitanicus CBS 277.49]
MAPLKVIGAAFGRTGTEGLRAALNKLGYKTYHMRQFWEDEELNPDDFYEAYIHRDQADWDKLYANYDAAVDWPTCNFYKELIVKYPDAKVLLTVRSADSWYESAKNTVFKASTTDMRPPEGSRMASFLRMVSTVPLDGLFVDNEAFADEERIKKIYLDHIEDVKKTVPAERLLIMELGEGWTRLCNFLGKEIPNEPYPSTNSSEDFQKLIRTFENNPETATLPDGCWSN